MQGCIGCCPRYLPMGPQSRTHFFLHMKPTLAKRSSSQLGFSDLQGFKFEKFPHSALPSHHPHRQLQFAPRARLSLEVGFVLRLLFNQRKAFFLFTNTFPTRKYSCFWARLKEPVAGSQQPPPDFLVSLSSISSRCDTFQATFRCRHSLTQELAANSSQYFETTPIEQAQPNFSFVQTVAWRKPTITKMTLIMSSNRRRYLTMARLLTPSPSFASPDAIKVGKQDETSAAMDDGDIIAKNRLVIRKHEPVPRSTIYRILDSFRTL